MPKRSDGYYIKNINPYQKIMPHLMKDRHDSMNMCNVELRYETIENFVDQLYKDTGVHYNYMDVMMCSLVRLFAMRPSLNRFVMNGRIYQHNDISVSFVVKKKLRDNSDDTTVKLHFTGEETLQEVKAKIDKVVEENTGDAVYNGTDNLAKTLTSTPHWVIRFLVNMLTWLDHRGWLPKDVVEFSPFHNSMFITFLKSINGDSIYHHCYDFGTTGIFLAIGKEKYRPVIECGELKVGKVMDVGVVMDERFCDGMYFVNSMRVWKRMLANPKQLLEAYKVEEQLANGVHDKETEEFYEQLRRQRAEKIKADKKAAKQAEKQAKKEAKKK